MFLYPLHGYADALARVTAGPRSFSQGMRTAQRKHPTRACQPSQRAGRSSSRWDTSKADETGRDAHHPRHRSHHLPGAGTNNASNYHRTRPAAISQSVHDESEPICGTGYCCSNPQRAKRTPRPCFLLRNRIHRERVPARSLQQLRKRPGRRSGDTYCRVHTIGTSRAHASDVGRRVRRSYPASRLRCQ